MNTRQATTSSSKDMDISVSPWWACIIQCLNLTMHSVFCEVGTAASQVSSHVMKNHADQEAEFGSPFTSTLVSLVARESNSRTWKSIATTSESAYLMSPNESLEILYNSPYTWISRREERSSVPLRFLDNFSFTTHKWVICHGFPSHHTLTGLSEDMSKHSPVVIRSLVFTFFVLVQG